MFLDNNSGFSEEAGQEKARAQDKARWHTQKVEITIFLIDGM